MSRPLRGETRDHNRTGFADHMVGSRPIKRKKNLHRMIIIITWQNYILAFFSLLDSGVYPSKGKIHTYHKDIFV